MDGGRWIQWEWQAPAPRQPRWREVVDCVVLWSNRAKQRRQLAALDDRLLADIGINRCDVIRECAKRFWEA